MYRRKLVYVIMLLYALYFFISTVGAYNSEFINLTDESSQGFERKESFYFKASSHNVLQSLSCGALQDTKKAPYVVIILYKTSGKFMGMGVLINSKTVLTSKEAVALAKKDPTTILILAGYRSPWWGKNSQVRRGEQMLVNDFGLVLIEVEDDFKFNKRIKPIEVTAVPDSLDDNYFRIFVIFGVQTTKEFAAGDSLSKSEYYYGGLHTLNTKNDCGPEYTDLAPEFTDSYHQCFFPNATFCAGCIGSPVVGGRLRRSGSELVGVVVKTNCLLRTRQVVAVKLTTLSHWVKTHAFYGKINPE